jgi:hypothetical protein
VRFTPESGHVRCTSSKKADMITAGGSNPGAQPAFS